MRTPRSFASVSLLFVVVACAHGDAITTGSGGGNSGGSDGDGGQGAINQGGDPTNNVTNTTTGPPCSEQPCKLVAPQCGCEVGYACTVDGPGSRACVQAGTAGQSEPCDDTTFCEAGTICVGYTDAQTSCATFCEDNSQCAAPGGKCVLELTDAGGVMLCSENCDLISGQGCLLGGTSCQIGITEADEAFTVCAPSGAGVAQALCADSSECAIGFVCLPTTDGDDRCFEWCNAANAGTCPPDLPTCTALEITTGVPLTIGNVTYGVCNP